MRINFNIKEIKNKEEIQKVEQMLIDGRFEYSINLN
jgi:hypothetical protein